MDIISLSQIARQQLPGIGSAEVTQPVQAVQPIANIGQDKTQQASAANTQTQQAVQPANLIQFSQDIFSIFASLQSQSSNSNSLTASVGQNSPYSALTPAQEEKSAGICVDC